MPISTRYTFAQLVAQVADERRVTLSGDSLARTQRDLQIALSRVWEILTRTDQGIGVALREVTIAEGALYDQTPGPSVPVPDDFRRVASLRINGYEARRITTVRMEALRDRPGAGDWRSRPGRPYYISGPGQVTDDQLITTATATRIETYPDWQVGDRYRLLYVTQPPVLTESGEVDLLMEPVVRYVVAMAALRGTPREDQVDRARLQAALAEAAAEFDPARAARAGGVRTLADYARPGW